MTRSVVDSKLTAVTMPGGFTDRGRRVSGTVSYERTQDGVTCATGLLEYTAKLRTR